MSKKIKWGIAFLLLGVILNAVFTYVVIEIGELAKVPWWLALILAGPGLLSFLVGVILLIPSRTFVFLGENVNFLLVSVTKGRKGESSAADRPSDRDLALTLTPDQSFPAVPDPRLPTVTVTVTKEPAKEPPPEVKP